MKRLLISVPVFMLCFIIMLMPYDALWRYFAWSNQVLSVFTLWTITVWLGRHAKPYIITLIPALFMTMVTVSYIFFAPEGLGIITESLMGLSIGYEASILIGGLVSALLLWLFFRSMSRQRLNDRLTEDNSLDATV